MKICQHCGSHVLDEDNYCPNCGASSFRKTSESVFSTTTPSGEEEDKTVGMLSIVFGVFMPLIGLILAIVGLSKYQQAENRKLCKIGLAISIILPAIIILLWVIFVIMLASALMNICVPPMLLLI